MQPGLVGLIDGTLSTLAPIFAAALLSGSHAALFVGLATAVGAGISMGFSEALSDDGTQTGRGSAVARGIVTGVMTAIGGVFHSLPFLISEVHTALVVAGDRRRDRADRDLADPQAVPRRVAAHEPAAGRARRRADRRRRRRLGSA